MDLESEQIKLHVRALRQIDLQLAYLAVLTLEGLKPLSRWEKPLDNGQLQSLKKLSLRVKQIQRSVKTGKLVTETIFSVSPGYIDLYEKRFGGKPIDKSPRTVRLEGFLFGFPPCCVDKFIARPYAKNDLDPADQKILFHWACKNCKITPLLLGDYRKILDFVEKCRPSP